MPDDAVLSSTVIILFNLSDVCDEYGYHRPSTGKETETLSLCNQKSKQENIETTAGCCLCNEDI